MLTLVKGVVSSREYVLFDDVVLKLSVTGDIFQIELEITAI